MTLKDDERKMMSDLYMEHAQECLRAAEELIEQYPKFAIERAYYSMHHVARGILFAEGVTVKSHEGVNNRFSDIFVKTGRISKEMFRTMGETEQNRYKAEYNPRSTYSPEEAKVFVEHATKFVDAIEKIMSKEREESLPAASEPPLHTQDLETGLRVIFTFPDPGKDAPGSHAGFVSEIKDNGDVLLNCLGTIIRTSEKSGTYTRHPDQRDPIELAKATAQQHVGEEGHVYSVRANEIYKGPIIDKTPDFVIQKTHSHTVRMHSVHRLGKEAAEKLQTGDNVAIAYSREGKATITPNQERQSHRSNDRDMGR